jgi:hypothetical protein
MDEIIGGYKKFQTEELRNLYSSPNIIRMIKLTRMRRSGYVARMGENRSAYNVLTSEPEGCRLLERSRRD